MARQAQRPRRVSSLPHRGAKGYLSLVREYWSYSHQLWPALRGTTLHKILEGEPGAVYETRISRTWHFPLPDFDNLPCVFTGKSDKLVPDERLLVDWKTIEAMPKSPSENHAWQLNIYRWIPRALDLMSGSS